MTAVIKNDHGHQKWPRSPKMTAVTKNNRGHKKWPRSEKATAVNNKYDRREITLRQLGELILVSKCYPGH